MPATIEDAFGAIGRGDFAAFDRPRALGEEARAGFMRYWRPLSPFIGVVLRAQLRVVAAGHP